MHLLRWGGGGRGGWGFGCDFRSLDWVDLHGCQDLFEAVEDFVAVDVLGQTIFGRYRSDVQRELVAGSILENMEVLGIALASSLSGDRFGGAEFEVTEH